MAPVLTSGIGPEVVVNDRPLAFGEQHQAVGGPVLGPDDGEFPLFLKRDGQKDRCGCFLDFPSDPEIRGVGDPRFFD